MKICISGAGIAGPALAYWLLRHGHEPVIVEKSARFRDGGYVIDFWGRGFDLTERMGLLPLVMEAGYRLREVRIVDENGRRAGGFHTESMVKAMRGRFVSLPRGDLARIIYDSVKDHVETLFDDSIADLAESGSEVQVKFTRTPPRAFDLVIGADGLHSKVRKLSFPSEAVREDYLGYHVAAFEATGYRPRDELAYVSFARPGRQIARFATRHDHTLFMMIFAAPQPIETRNVEAQRAVLRDTFGNQGWECDAILAAMERSDSLYFDRVSQVHMPRWSRGRVALLGDAAHCPSLLAGEGCGLAIIDAYVLAGELASSPQHHARAFAAYERQLMPFVEGKQRAARRFAGQFAPRTEFGIKLRNLATRAMAIPGVTDLLIGRALRDRIELPNY